MSMTWWRENTRSFRISIEKHLTMSMLYRQLKSIWRHPSAWCKKMCRDSIKIMKSKWLVLSTREVTWLKDTAILQEATIKLNMILLNKDLKLNNIKRSFDLQTALLRPFQTKLSKTRQKRMEAGRHILVRETALLVKIISELVVSTSMAVETRTIVEETLRSTCKPFKRLSKMKR